MVSVRATKTKKEIGFSREGIEQAAGVATDVYECLDSTNTEARRRIMAGDCGPRLIVAKAQSAGRGRFGRAFYSPPGSGVYMTLYWPVGGRCDVSAVSAVTIRAAVAVAEALEAATGEVFGIKWVNDIFRNGKKVCGILAESVGDAVTGQTAAFMVGIGINITTSAFPPELHGIAGAVSDTPLDAGALIGGVISRFLTLQRAPGDYMEEYRRRSVVLGRDVMTVCGEISLPGRVVAIEDDGSLLVERPDGRREKISAGEVSLRGNF